MEQIQLKLEKIADCFDDMSQLFQSVKLEFEMLKEKTVTNNVVTQTEEINSQLSEKDEEKIFKIGHMLVQNTRTISELNEQIQKFQTLKTSFNDEKFYDEIIQTLLGKKKETEDEMEERRKSINDIPDWYEKDLLNFFSELPDEEMSNDIDELFEKFRKMKNDMKKLNQKRKKKMLKMKKKLVTKEVTKEVTNYWD